MSGARRRTQESKTTTQAAESTATPNLREVTNDLRVAKELAPVEVSEQIDSALTRIALAQEECQSTRATATRLEQAWSSAANVLQARQAAFAAHATDENEAALEEARFSENAAERAALEANAAHEAACRARDESVAAFEAMKADRDRFEALRRGVVLALEAAVEKERVCAREAQEAEAAFQASEAEVETAKQELSLAETRFDEANDASSKDAVRSAESKVADAGLHQARASRLRERARASLQDAAEAGRAARAQLLELDTSDAAVDSRSEHLLLRFARACLELIAVEEEYAELRSAHDNAHREHVDLVGSKPRLSRPSFPSLPDLALRARPMVHDAASGLREKRSTSVVAAFRAATGT